MDCVEVCPVDCFYEGENMLVINPDECIDCGVCEPECPVEAIIQGEEDNPWYELNNKWSQEWPNISLARPEDVPSDASDWKDVPDKIKYFSEKPGKGD
jgi:ferredoxin